MTEFAADKVRAVLKSSIEALDDLSDTIYAIQSQVESALNKMEDVPTRVATYVYGVCPLCHHQHSPGNLCSTRVMVSADELRVCDCQNGWNS